MLYRAYGVTLADYVGGLSAAQAEVMLAALQDDRVPSRVPGRSAFAQPPNLDGL